MQHDTDKERSIGFLVHEVARLFRRRFEDEARVHGVTLPQWRVIAELYRSEGVSQVALAGCVDSDPMTLSGVLDRLEKRGLVDRYTDPTDSRAKLAKLTDEGRDLYITARTVGREVYENALDGLSTEDRETVIASLLRIRSNLNEMTADQKEAV